MKVFIVGSYAPSLVNFRGPLLKALVSRGHQVTAFAPRCSEFENVDRWLKAISVNFRVLPFSRASLNPLSDFWSLLNIVHVLVKHRPDFVVAYTIKPVVYVGMGVRLVRLLGLFQFSMHYSALVTGLGYAFGDMKGVSRWRKFCLQSFFKLLCREGLAGANLVIFQNPDDQALFHQLGLVPRSARSVRSRGSGVDLSLFKPCSLPSEHVFLMMARLLVEKGVREYAQAAMLVKNRYPNAVFCLAGSLDANPSAISRSELVSWVESGFIDYLGGLDDVTQALCACRYYVLPSFYREGTPRSVLEAMAIGRPIITTDSPGCRETVVDGVNGFLVPPRDHDALAAAMIRLIEQSEAESQRMAQSSLDFARDLYDVHKVNAHLIKAMQL